MVHDLLSLEQFVIELARDAYLTEGALDHPFHKAEVLFEIGLRHTMTCEKVKANHYDLFSQ